eukprot:CAMPEP_0115158266 /NCGR_PEP_ID=MMETSP0227-20121206/69486_1 /TAXON_ID=89957 /ORGANISM="Polarella glacialis, Strain CCMP 1383" /LENGTH=164 /DNA_ID=CAMNT_0002569697 /DNA_START=57 /DNA_END=547 /DNA_ORIENTATION=-
MSVFPPMMAWAGIGLPEGVLALLPYVSPLRALLGSVVLFNTPHMVKICSNNNNNNQNHNNNNNNPRAQYEELKSDRGYGDDISRAQAAHSNGLESFPVFGVGVVACLAVGADNTLAGKLACAHLISRVGFNIFYMGVSTNLAGGAARSICWFVSLLTSCQLIML